MSEPREIADRVDEGIPGVWQERLLLGLPFTVLRLTQGAPPVDDHKGAQHRLIERRQ